MLPSLDKIVESIPDRTAHAVGVGSGTVGLTAFNIDRLEGYAHMATSLTAIVGFFAACLAAVGAAFYGLYWILKVYAKWRRVKRGDFSDGTD